MSSPPVISALPSVPATSDPNFETLAPALFTAIKNTFISEVNAVASWINAGNWLTTPPVFDSCTITGNLIVDTNTLVVSSAWDSVGIGTTNVGSFPYGAKLNVAGSISCISTQDTTIGFAVTDRFTLGSRSIAHYGLTLGITDATTQTILSGYFGLGFAEAGVVHAKLYAGKLSVGGTHTALGKLDVRTTSGAQIVSSHDNLNYMLIRTNSTGRTEFSSAGFNTGYSWNVGTANPNQFSFNNDHPNAVGSILSFSTEGVIRGYIGALKHGSSPATLFSGETADAFGLRAETVMQFGIGTTGVMQMTSAGLAIGGLFNPNTPLDIRDSQPEIRLRDTSAVGASAYCILGFQDNTGSNIGYVGYGSGSTPHLYITNFLAGDIFLTANSQGAVFNSSGNLGVGITSSIAARIHAVSTTEQMRLGYDGPNYASHTVNSSGDYTISPSGDGFTLDANDIRINQSPAGTAGSATGTYARINFNGTYYKLALLADS